MLSDKQIIKLVHTVCRSGDDPLKKSTAMLALLDDISRRDGVAVVDAVSLARQAAIEAWTRYGLISAPSGCSRNPLTTA